MSLESNSKESNSKIWAVLVGINQWENRNIRNLKGCLNDIEAVEKKLLDLCDQGKRDLDVKKLTEPYDGRNLALIPTFDNVKAAFRDAADKAKKKDVFYFHYCGHGGQQRFAEHQADHPSLVSGSTRKVESLILQGDRKLRDWELGSLLSKLADRDLAVFAALDCCHSGGADRLDENIRGLDIDFQVDDVPIPAEAMTEINASSIGDDRDGTAVATWWSEKSRNYTVFAACQPVEKAKEGKAKGNGKDGLYGETYGGLFTMAFLESLDKLFNLGGELPTCQDLHQYVCANISQLQHPMIYGQADRVFLGYEQRESVCYTTIVDLHGRKAYIGLGKLHGVQKEEKYRVHRLGTAILDENNSNSVIIKIDGVYLTTAFGYIPPNLSGIVQKGCAVTLAESIAPHALRVQVSDDELFERLSEAKGSDIIFKKKGNGCPYKLGLCERENEMPAVLALTKHEQLIYKFPHDRVDIPSILELVRKLPRYNQFNDLQNTSRQLEGCFEFTEISNKTVVDDGEIITLCITNKQKDYPLYYTIFNLRPNLEVILTSPAPNEGTSSLPISHYDREEVMIQMENTIQGAGEVQDTFLAMITDQPIEVGSLRIGRSGADDDSEPTSSSDYISNDLRLLLGSHSFRDGNRILQHVPIKWRTKKINIRTRNPNIAVHYSPLIQDLKDYVVRDPHRKEEFGKAMACAIDPQNGGDVEMAAESISTMESFYRFCNELLHWIPSVDTPGDALLRKVLVFYWVFNQANLATYQTPIGPASVQDDPKWLCYWQVIFAREIGRFLDTRESASGIQSFYDDPIHDQERPFWQDTPTGGWASFNHFLSRRWKDIDLARPIAMDDEPDHVIVSAADSCFNGYWEAKKGYVTIQGFHWPISKLIQDESFDVTAFMHAFSGPADYHRQHAPVSGTVVQAQVIQKQVFLQVSQDPDQVGLDEDLGFLALQNPAQEDTEDRDLAAPDEAAYQWCQTRGLIIIQTEHHGKVAVLPIGMTQASSVVLSVNVGQRVQKGQEISFSQFGGSDLVMVFEKKVVHDAEIGQKCNVRERIGVFEYDATNVP
ncbi:phosphatidylserine decarboxylase domain-containing protein [Trichoderma sp. SZMC 28014]